MPEVCSDLCDGSLISCRMLNNPKNNNVVMPSQNPTKTYHRHLVDICCQLFMGPVACRVVEILRRDFFQVVSNLQDFQWRVGGYPGNRAGFVRETSIRLISIDFATG